MADMEERYKKYLEKAKAVVRSLDTKAGSPDVSVLRHQVGSVGRRLDGTPVSVSLRRVLRMCLSCGIRWAQWDGGWTGHQSVDGFESVCMRATQEITVAQLRWWNRLIVLLEYFQRICYEIHFGIHFGITTYILIMMIGVFGRTGIHSGECPGKTGSWSPACYQFVDTLAFDVLPALSGAMWSAEGAGIYLPGLTGRRDQSGPVSGRGSEQSMVFVLWDPWSPIKCYICRCLWG